MELEGSITEDRERTEAQSGRGQMGGGCSANDAEKVYRKVGHVRYRGRLFAWMQLGATARPVPFHMCGWQTDLFPPS